ncbi:MAG: hypothetical protein SF066_14950 [Thermoanaerobaculia bacterium]|nr:hypothetical protein [Thermoanaerobaculia bacterium]
MKKALLLAVGLVALGGALVAGLLARWPESRPEATPPPPKPAAAPVAEVPPPAPQAPSVPQRAETPSAPAPHPEFLYGRVTTVDGKTFEGRLRWGGTQEAFWSDYFNGQKESNRWAPLVAADRLPVERERFEVFGFDFGYRDRPLSLRRLFMARFGDLARIEPAGDEVRLTMKNGAVVALARFEASDFDDGVRVWDAQAGVVELDSLRIRTIEFHPTPPLVEVPTRLHGTVTTATQSFTGFLQWDREHGIGSDELRRKGGRGIRLGDIRTIRRSTKDTATAVLHDGREIADAVHGNDYRGVYVDDARYGRVLVSWDAFQRLDLSLAGEAGRGATYDDFPAGSALEGTVSTRDGRRLAGRLVFDLDESETTETLDAPLADVDYTIPFSLVAEITPEEGAVRVRLRNGEELRLEPKGDLGPSNLGLLIFREGESGPEYVAWGEVLNVLLDSEAPAGRGGTTDAQGSPR